jgi:DNA repair protein RecN (Recombination protein N)
MLRALSIRDMVLIEAAELRFRPGLNVLTGETGAGKSILLDCLGFVLGWRGRGGSVRAGAEQGEVLAEFELGPGHRAGAILEAAGLPAGEELILRRTVAADGRRQGWVNDRRVTAETLRARGVPAGLRYYTPEIHVAAFAHPAWMAGRVGH